MQQLALHSRMLILQTLISIKLKPDTKSTVAALGMQTTGNDRSVALKLFSILNLSKQIFLHKIIRLQGLPL